jgi:KOW motif-containing protein
MKFEPGDEVIVIEGEFKGHYGTVIQFEDTFAKYYVILPERHLFDLFPFDEGDLDFLPPEEPEEEVDEIPVYDFGIPQSVLHSHLEWLISRSLEHVGDVGPDQAFFGYQEFEGKTASEVLVELMTKLEEGMAMFAQAHILIGRIVAALESVHDQNK